MSQHSEDQARLWAKVVAKAWADEAFKTKLIKDPAAVLKAEGIELPQGAQIKVVEDAAALRHLVLPAMPAEAASLDEAVRNERLAAEGYCGSMGSGWAY
ncbi:MAG: NHLP leader peptide family natural product precursor [Desulfarculus sp.]|nr:NHLP leader peptide family natural product precursor [Desulfarculus sp.]